MSRGPSTARRSPQAPRAGRERRLRRVSELPPRAKLFLVVAEAAIVAFAVWVTTRFLALDGRGVAIILSVICCVGLAAVGVAVVTVTRIAFSAGALPYLMGRGVRRLLGRR